MTMSYLLKRTDGAYVAPSGRESSYTRDLRKARIFQSLSAAEAERCIQNEHVVTVDSQLRQ